MKNPLRRANESAKKKAMAIHNPSEIRYMILNPDTRDPVGLSLVKKEDVIKLLKARIIKEGKNYTDPLISLSDLKVLEYYPNSKAVCSVAKWWLFRAMTNWPKEDIAKTGRDDEWA